MGEQEARGVWLQGLGGQPAQDEADLWSRAEDRQARCREVGPSCPSGPQAALAVGASGRGLSGAPSAHPLAPGSGPLSRSANQSRARNGQVFWGSSAQVFYGQLSQEGSGVYTRGTTAGLRTLAPDDCVTEHPCAALRPRT